MVGVITPERALDHVRRVLRGQGRGRAGVVVDDVGNILEARRAGVRISAAFCTPSEEIAAEALSDAGLPVTTVSDEVAKDLFGTERVSRVFALAHPGRPRSLRSLGDDERDLVVLDGVRLMGNIGAIIRTTAALGGSGLVLLNSGLRSIYDRRLIRASRGLVFRLPTVLSTSQELLGFCDEQQLPLIVSGIGGASMDVTHLALLAGRVGLVLGGERDGCSELLDQRARARVRIGMTDRVESLNVSVAAGIVLSTRSVHNLRLCP